MTDLSTISNETASAVVPTNEVQCVDCGSQHVEHRGPCPLTSSIHGLPEHEKQLITARGAGQLYYCRDCGLGFRHPQVNEIELQALYANMPVRRWKYEDQANTAWSLACRWLTRRGVASNTPPRLLDVGAFDGIFLKSLDTSWQRFAIEPSAAASLKLQELGIPVLDQFLAPPAPNFAASFDVVTMFDVFEHLRQPGTALVDALAYLKPGGYLILSTGNCDHWTWNWLQGDHWYCHPLQHLTFGSRQFFTNWAQQHNCRCSVLTQHAHCPGALTTRLGKVIATLVWGGLKFPSTRLLASMALRIPGLGYLRHRQTGPYAPELADHLFVVLQKQPSP